MMFLKLFLGLFFFFLGWIYLYKPNLVSSLNRFARDIIFNDRRILLERKKFAIFFFCLSFIALYMGLSAATGWLGTTRKDDSRSYLMYMAMQDYCTDHFQNAIEKYEKILKQNPDDVEVLKRMAFTYDTWGEKKKARVLWRRILRLDIDEKARRKIDG